MILTDIRLENFKQYGGVHNVSIREAGLIAVIGANGVGKTTLFEAIEWCLYKPKTLANMTVRTRNGSGPTRVTVRLTDPGTGACYVVDRRMVRSGNVEAVVFLADQPESRLANGTGEVSTYVSRHLIGLNHKAFVSTFFTRQKELSFFGGLGPTERRRDVGGLLGHDAIVQAGEIMKAETDEAAKQAGIATEVHRAESSGRDFDAELAASEAAIVSATEGLERAELAHRDRAEALSRITMALDTLRDVERRHQVLTQRITALNGDHLVALQQQGAATANLEAIDEQAAKRPTVAALADLEPGRVAAVAEQQCEREREAERRNLSTDLASLDQSEHQLASDLRSTVVTSTPSFIVPGWSVANAGATTADEAARLLEVIGALPLADAIALDRAVSRCREAMSARDTAARHESRLGQEVAAVSAERNRALADGDPSELVAPAAAELDRLRSEWVVGTTELKRLEKQIEQLKTITIDLRKFEHNHICETCHRPFTREEVALQIGINQRNLDQWISERDQLEIVAASLKQAGVTAGERHAGLLARVDQIRQLDARLDAIRREHRQAAENLSQLEAAVRRVIVEAGLDAEPNDTAVREASERAAALTGIANKGTELERILRDARSIAADRERLSRDLSALGPSRYDPSAHRAADVALQEARAAIVTLRGIDEQLARRPAIEQQLGDACDRAAAVLGLREETERERVALGFDPRSLAALEDDAQLATSVERAAFIAANDAQRALETATTARRDIRQARERVAALAEEANRKLREADDLARMRDGFKDFEKYVAGRVNPILGERTAEFLALVTDGVYDQVQFDNDYGLYVFDDDRAFPISEFSGGERDVAALCARLALSTVIGDQAAHPPGFVVLDEVFGSLDQERRALVLDTLRNLTGQDRALQQLFVISHVEEVNTSPLVDEVWHVAIRDGVSNLDQDPRDGTISLERAEELLLGEE